MDNKLSFHHVGVACHDIELTKPFYLALGYEATETVIDPIQNVKICFLNKSCMPQIELLAPVDESSPIHRTLEVSGVTPYHFCYEVDDIASTIEELREQHFMALSKPQPACAIGSRLVCFLFKKEVGLIELVEK
ncbi:MAG: VOC family protein [Muribaculaceae bacterium]|nr:VOC family protein [Muribaculaceae bacterium]